MYNYFFFSNKLILELYFGQEEYFLLLNSYLCPRDWREQNATSDAVELDATAYPFLTTDIDWNIYIEYYSIKKNSFLPPQV